MLAAPAFAQQTGDTSATPQKAQSLETIVVTGSHIRRVDLETSNPVIAIDAAQIQQSGKVTLGDLVQQLPAVTGSNTNPQVNNGGGTGATSIGLRGLGGQRTLILVDGNRVLNGNGINADPNAIPINMIERIEVLTDGASSVYGSDAVGGVVNFILRKNYQGAEFSADYGISDHNDGERRGYHFVFGQTSDKGSILAGIDYNKQDEVLSSRRDFAKDALSISADSNGNPVAFVGGSSFAAFGRIQLPASLANSPTYAGCKDSSGNVFVALNPGASGQNPLTDYHCFVNGGPNNDKFNFASVNLILTPTERTNAFFNGTYHLNDNIDTYLTYYHNKTSSGFQLAPALMGSGAGAVISADSYYNPFGEEFSSSGLDYRERLVSVGNRAAQFGTVNDQLNGGFKGNLTLFDQDWSWDVGYGYGHFSQTTITLGLPNQDKLNQGMGPSMLDPATGQVVCVATPGDLSTEIQGCTPFNPFNLFDPNSVAALRAAAVPAISQAYTIERYEHADVSGGLFNLPAGTAQLAGGVVYRKEYTRSVIDPLLLINPATGNCTLGSQCSSPLQGGFNVKEAYAELFVPILKDLPFARALNFTVGDRYSKYSTFGSTNNTKFAVEYRPIDDLLLRGTVSEVFRAPSVGNVFASPISDAPLLSSDPCDGYTGTPVNPACVNVPTNGTFHNNDVALGQQISGLASGSQFAGFPLGPEKGKSFDWGFVYSPEWLPGMSVSVDYWRVYLNDTIAAIGAQSVLNLCSAGQTQFCPLISRFSSGPNQGQIQQIIEPTGNLGRTDTRGVDLSLQYRLPQFSFGQFSINFNATYLAQYDQQTAPGTDANVTFHDAGHFMGFGSQQAAACPPGGGGVCLFPRWRAQSAVMWQLGNWSASWRMRYIGRFRLGSPDPSQQDDFLPGVTGSFRDYGSTTYHDISASYNIEPINTRVDVGIDNAFDKQPPLLYANHTLNANTDPSNFDLMGRFYFARVTVKF